MRNGDQGSKMEDDILSLHNAAHESRIANVAAHWPQLGTKGFREIIEPATMVERIVKTECGNLGSAAHELFRQMRADKAVCASNKNFEVTIVHASLLLPCG